ncbi:TolB family protein [Chitinophaga vietnamensis]|uniref:TolB family protein n=1 Tax=Chitinophaga vietnamensis TaxID=2593957 RepID=UPI001177CC5D|nr:PD40 domain-containing protein [Chitinophaga vietnamensis]
MKCLPFFILLLSSAALQAQHPSYYSSRPLREPVMFAEGSICTGDYDTHPSFSPGTDTLFFVKCAPDFSTWTIVVSYFKQGQWSTPEVAPFSGKYMDADPFFTKDGKTLFFISNRPLSNEGPPKDFDIWKVEATPQGWSAPIHLEAPINSNKDEYYPTMADNGTLYFGSGRDGGKGNTDIYRCPLENGQYRQAENLGDNINTADDEYEPFIAPDERYLIFMATRPNTAKGDLFLSYRRNGQWTPAERLPAPFNSEKSEYSPKVTRDNKYFFFSSTRNKLTGTPARQENAAALYQRLHSAGNGLGDIYYVDLEQLHLK